MIFVQGKWLDQAVSHRACDVCIAMGALCEVRTNGNLEKAKRYAKECVRISRSMGDAQRVARAEGTLQLVLQIIAEQRGGVGKEPKKSGFWRFLGGG